MTRAERLAWVRGALQACGGWNARSRGVLQAWASAHGIGAAELESLVIEAAGAVPRSTRSEPQLPPVEPRRPRRRWWAAAGAALGLAVSLMLAQRLVQRWPSAGAPAKPAPQAASPPAVAPDRALPPVPIPFPRPPDVNTAAPVASAEPLRAGGRPSGEAGPAELQAFRQSVRSLSTSWPGLDPEPRSEALQELATWLAGSPSRSDLERLQTVLAQEVQAQPDAGSRMLAEALVALLVDRAARSESLTSSAGAVFGSRAAGSRVDPLRSWALDRLPLLASALRQSDGHRTWAAWLRAVGCMSDASTRVEVAVQALDALLRSGSRLDGPGLAADVAASLLRGVPSEAGQPGFDRVRSAMVGWLGDTSIDSPTLWGLGGVWRTLPGAPSPMLLPGERDSAGRRGRLADAWLALQPASEQAPWQASWTQLQALEASAPTDEVAWVRRAAELVLLLRRVHAARAGLDPSQVQAAPEPPPPASQEPAPPADRWNHLLADPAPERRLLGLDEIRTAQPEELGWGDAERVAAIALAGRGREERDLAIELLRGPLAATPSVRRGLLLEASVTADLRRAVEVLEIACGRPLPGADAEPLRAQAVAFLLRAEPVVATDSALQQAAARLQVECARWASHEGLAAHGDDAAELLWRLADRRARQVDAVAVPQPTRDAVSRLSGRARRLRHLACCGPQGTAAATMTLAAWQAAWLSAERPHLAAELRGMLEATRAQAATASDALPQACLALACMLRMELACLGAPMPPPPPSSQPASASELLARAAKAVGDPRQGLMRQAWVAGGGAMLPPPSADTAGALALLQAVSWCQRGQADRLLKAAAADSARTFMQGLAARRGMDLAAWCRRMQDLPDPDRWRELQPACREAGRLLRIDMSDWTERVPPVPVP